MAGAITEADITEADITLLAIMAEAITLPGMAAIIEVGGTKIDPPTNITSWAGRTTATSGSAIRDTVGMPTE